jgi:hypothetical protein
MATNTKESHVEAIEAASATMKSGPMKGETFVLKPGEVLASDHPIVKAYPHFFRPLTGSRRRPQVEDMTNEPGRKRGE